MRCLYYGGVTSRYCLHCTNHFAHISADSWGQGGQLIALNFFFVYIWYQVIFTSKQTNEAFGKQYYNLEEYRPVKTVKPYLATPARLRARNEPQTMILLQYILLYLTEDVLFDEDHLTIAVPC